MAPGQMGFNPVLTSTFVVYEWLTVTLLLQQTSEQSACKPYQDIQSFQFSRSTKPFYSIRENHYPTYTLSIILLFFNITYQ